MNVLVIAPHPDDESIGCGGTLALHSDRGDRVVAAFLTSGEQGIKSMPRAAAWRLRECEAQDAAEVLGFARLVFLRQPDWFVEDNIAEAAGKLRAVLDAETPERIYLPHPGEWHPDHAAAQKVLREALGPRAGDAPELLCYEVWTPLSAPDAVENITSTFLRKRRAIQCYVSQLAEFRYDRAVQGLNRFRGELGAKCRYAEAFSHCEPSPSRAEPAP